MLPSKSSHRKAVYNPKAFILHAALLHQAFAHCGKFPTAASRRSLGRVSVPVWLIILSDQLLIIALVSFYLTNKLIRRRPFPKRSKALIRRSHAVLDTISGAYPSLWGTFQRVTQPSAARQHSHLLLDFDRPTKLSIASLVMRLIFLQKIPASCLFQQKVRACYRSTCMY
jgi:hypothetical protein